MKRRKLAIKVIIHVAQRLSAVLLVGISIMGLISSGMSVCLSLQYCQEGTLPQQPIKVAYHRFDKTGKKVPATSFLRHNDTIQEQNSNKLSHNQVLDQVLAVTGHVGAASVGLRGTDRVIIKEMCYEQEGQDTLSCSLRLFEVPETLSSREKSTLCEHLEKYPVTEIMSFNPLPYTKDQLALMNEQARKLALKKQEKIGLWQGIKNWFSGLGEREADSDTILTAAKVAGELLEDAA